MLKTIHQCGISRPGLKSPTLPESGHRRRNATKSPAKEPPDVKVWGTNTVNALTAMELLT